MTSEGTEGKALKVVPSCKVTETHMKSEGPVVFTFSILDVY